MSTQPLNLNTLPLDGVHLIEASAGTGKTYTIATLYLRLLLERGLSVKQILVVTFTNAATEELRDRIRKRIREALQQLQGRTEGEGDPALQAVLAVLDDRKAALQILKDALTLMDEAAVFTIHSFCQRMLSENAFESGSLFDADFITDEGDYLRAIAEDFWRSHFYALEVADAEWVASQWKGPAALLAGLRRYLDRHELTVIPQVSPNQLAALLAQRHELVKQVQQQWQQQRAELRELLANEKGFNGNKYRKNTVAKAQAAMDQFCEQHNPLALSERIDLLSASKIATVMKKGFSPPKHHFFNLVDELIEVWATSESLRRVVIMQQFMEYSRRTLSERKTLHNVLSSEDLLVHLSDALKGSAAEALAARIRQQYPMAMVDEFQDTDPVQYSIFRSIYHQQPDCGLYMIGDPKQAIYSFRGADIFTYMQARHDTSHHYTLDTNWRSSSQLIAAVNQLFSSAHKPFIYEDDIQFHPVKASIQADEKPLLINGEQIAPLQVWQVLREEGDGKVINKDRVKPLLAQCCAEQIAQLLNQGLSGSASLGDEPLHPNDIAILVRNHKEAGAVQQALRSCGIASAYISRESVFNSREAEALGRLLLAVLEPGNERRLRAALCDEMMGLNAQQLLETLEDDNLWERRLAQFQHYHTQWRDYGFMSMFQKLLHQQQLPQTLLATSNGERALSNLLQLAELLQAASKQQHGMEGLLHWYFEQLTAKGEDEERQLRLESDEALVQIVTIHKSKGLEYEVVFLPYLYESRVHKRENPVKPIEFHAADSNKLVLDLGSKDYDNSVERAETERLAEDLRLLYVALTRAKQRCYLAWGPIKGAAESALGYLLHNGQMAELTDGQILERWQQLAQQAPGAIAVQQLPEITGEFYRGGGDLGGQLQLRSFNGEIERSWQISSFSALTSSRGHRAILPDYDASEPITERPKLPSNNIFTFPRGANAGTMMHTLFENIDFTQSQGRSVAEVSAEQLAKYGYEAHWQPVIETMVHNVLNTELDRESGLTLAQISNNQRLIELAFYYPLANINATKLNKLLGEVGGYPGEGAALNFMPHQGIMTGFVDLIFEYQGRYYIADYKSNHLGEQLADYQPAQLEAAMQQHRYDLQYLIYTVALHRYLKQRLTGYEYERDFGGVYYLFLRGITPEQGSGSGVYFNKPEYELIEQLDQLFSSSANPAQVHL